TRTWDRRRIFEAALLLLSLIVVGGAVFAFPTPLAMNNYPLEILCVPFLLWAALRFRPRETAIAILLLSAIAIWGTLRGFGPFRKNTVNESLLLLQTFIAVIAVTKLTLSAMAAERRRAEESLALLESAVHHSVEGVLILAASKDGALS